MSHNPAPPDRAGRQARVYAAARACPHQPWAGGPHCAEMICAAYVSKCPCHGPVSTGDRCSLGEPFPLTPAPAAAGAAGAAGW